MPIVSLPPVSLLPLDHGHVMAWTSVGDAAAPPVLILHGGPGGRSRAASVNWFEGLGLRCIVHDQRGCGASTPAGACGHNDLDTLVADIERLREHLGLAHWAVAGGSWGALLAVAYAARHPQRVDGLFLRSAFLGSAAEVDHFFRPWSAWLGEAGAAWLGWPSPLMDFEAQTVPCSDDCERVAVPDPVRLLDLIAARSGPRPDAARVAGAWQAFEQAQAAPGGLPAHPEARWTRPKPPAEAEAAPAPATEAARSPAADAAATGASSNSPRAPGALPPPVLAGLPPGLQVQWHYLRQGCFVDAAWREAALGRLAEVLVDRPVVLVHGQADAVCDVAVSRALARRWPRARLVEVPGAGHDMDHPALRQALGEAASVWSAAWLAAASRASSTAVSPAWSATGPVPAQAEAQAAAPPVPPVQP